MSLTAKGLDLYLSRDPAVDFTRKASFPVTEGAKYQRWQQLASQNSSPSGLSWSFQPPAGVALGRDVRMQVSFNLTFTGLAGNTGTLLKLGSLDAPRRAPLNSIIANIAVQLNNATPSLNSWQVIDPLMRCGLDWDELDRDMSTFPSMPDYTNSYTDPWRNTPASSRVPWEAAQNTGPGKDPLTSNGLSSQGRETRGGWQITNYVDPVVAVGTLTTATLTLTTTEALLVTPFGCGSRYDDALALMGIQTMNVTCNFTNTIRQIWSHVFPAGDIWPGATFADQAAVAGCPGMIQSITMTGNPTAYLLLRFLTPDITEKIPDVISYGYNVMNVYTFTNNQTVLPGVTTPQNITTQSQTLAYIPRRFMLWVKALQDADLPTSAPSEVYSDSYFRIDSINLTWASQNGIYAGANTQQLYEISRANGLRMSFEQWNNSTGSIFIGEFGRDFGLDNSSEAVSVGTSKQLQMSISVTNLSKSTRGNASTFMVYLATISDGTIDLGLNSAITNIDVLQPEDVVRVKASGVALPEHFNVPTSNIYGGKVNRKFIDILKKGAHALKDIAKKEHLVSRGLVEFGAPKIVSDIAAMQGYGRASKAALMGQRN